MTAETRNATGGYPAASPANRAGGPVLDSGAIVPRAPMTDKTNGRLDVGALAVQFLDVPAMPVATTAPVIPTAEPGYRVLDRAALRSVGRRQPVYLFDGFIENNTTGMIFGDWGTGKTFYAVHIAATVAQAHNVLYIAAEGARGIAKRVDVWEMHNGKQAERLYVIGEVVDVEGRLADILAVIDRLRPALVVWDTLSRHMSIAGWNENFANEYGLFHARLDSIRNEYGCSHLVVHHVSRAGNERGSTQIPGNMDAIDALERHGQLKGVVSVTPKKRKDDAAPGETWYELRTYETGNVDETTGRPILDTHGQPETSCVLVPINLADKANMAPAALRQIMTAIDGGHVTPKQIETATGMSHATVARALKKMLDDGLIANDGKGRYALTTDETD